MALEKTPGVEIPSSTVVIRNQNETSLNDPPACIPEIMNGNIVIKCVSYSSNANKPDAIV